jgi:hypothetical protein
MKALLKFFSHRRVTLIVALAMIASSIWDLLEISSKAFLGFDLGAEHAVALAGFMHLAKALADADEGAEKLKASRKEAGSALSPQLETRREAEQK